MAAKKKTGAKVSTKKTGTKKAGATTTKKAGAKPAAKKAPAKKAPAKKATTKKATATKKSAATKAGSKVESFALCSAKVVGPKRGPILFAYREGPVAKGDSGWRFLNGTESRAYLDDAKHCLPCPLSLVLAMDPSVEGILEGKVGLEYVRKTAAAPWTRTPSRRSAVDR